MKIVSSKSLKAFYARFIAFINSDVRLTNARIARVGAKLKQTDEFIHARVTEQVTLLREDAAKTEQALRDELAEALLRIELLESSLHASMSAALELHKKVNSGRGNRVNLDTHSFGHRIG